MLLVLCVTACSTSRKATEVSSSVLTTDYTNLTDKHDSVIVIIRDTLREVTTITIRENRRTSERRGQACLDYPEREGGKPEVNEQGDTLRVSTVTDRDRLRSRENRRTKQEQSQARLGYALQGGGNAKRNLRRVETVTVTRIDTVYIQKDSLSVENKKIGLSASADGGSKKSGLSELFLCHDSGKPKRAWSLRSLLHRFLTYVKWIFALICAVVVLIIVVKVCLLRR